MTRLHHDRHASRVQQFFAGVGDLRGQSFLHLKTVAEEIDQARELAQSDDLAIREISDVDVPKKRQEMMLAETVELNALEGHHAVGLLREESVADDVEGVLRIAVGQLRQ